mgnify:CR=1 FL=1|tara:strand:- start:371 stop:1831 length:1461 start_codon:yes stop_codon:yes gene_type:complete
MSIANIIIKDEINCRIEGLDLPTRHKLHNTFRYEIPGARWSSAVKLGRWDGKEPFFSLGGLTYINLLDKIIPILEQSGYQFEITDNRIPHAEFKFETVDQDSYGTFVWPEGHVHANEPIALRDYQVEVINKSLENLQSTQRVPTAGGKTLVTAILSHKCEPYGRSMVIVPSEDLVKQTHEDYGLLGLDVGMFYGKQKDFSKTHTICTWQSLGSLQKNTQNETAQITMSEFTDNMACVIVDETHTAKAKVLKELLSGTALSHIPIRWGLTGTMPETEYGRVSVLTSIGPVVNVIKSSELQARGYLSKCNVNIQQLVDHGEYSSYQSELKYLVTKKERVEKLAELIIGIRETGNTLILVDRIETGKMLNTMIPDSVFVEGAMKSDERKEHYDEVKEIDDKTIIATYGVAAVGINIPRIFNLVLIEPGKSFVRVIQSIGRGLRVAEDKDYVQIWDMSSTLKYAKRHLSKRKKFYRDENFPHKVDKIDWI